MPDLSALDSFFSTPAIYTPNMSEEDWALELERMVLRTFLTRDFVDGKIPPSVFEEGLFELGLNPYICAENWEEGRTLMLP